MIAVRKNNRALERFARNIQVKPSVKRKLTNKIRSFTSCIRRTTGELNINYTPVGSLQRSSAIQFLGVSDGDYFVIVNASILDDPRPNLPRKIIEILATAAKRSMRAKRVRRFKNAITIEYSTMRMDILPACREASGYYFIPHPTDDDWVKADPRSAQQLLVAENVRSRGLLILCIRLLKAWNRKHVSRLRSYHLECLALSHIRSRSSCTSLWELFADFFVAFPRYINNSCIDPATGQRLDAYLDIAGRNSHRTHATNIAISTGFSIRAAYEYHQNNTPIPPRLMRSIFGASFFYYARPKKYFTK